MKLEQIALNGTLKVYTHKPRNREKYDLLLSVNNAKRSVARILETEGETRSSFKYQLIVQVRMKKVEYDESGNYTTRYLEPYFAGECQTFQQDRIHDDLENSVTQIFSHFDGFVQEGSGWTLDFVMLIKLQVYRMLPFSNGNRIRYRQAP